MTAVYYPCIRSCPLFLSYFFVTLAPKPMLKTAKEMLQPGAGGRTDESERIQKAKTMLSWIRPRGELYVSVWCQADQTGWDTYAGPKFVVEFQLGREPVIGKSEIRRARIGKMLSAAELRRHSNDSEQSDYLVTSASKKSCPS